MCYRNGNVTNFQMICIWILISDFQTTPQQLNKTTCAQAHIQATCHIHAHMYIYSSCMCGNDLHLNLWTVVATIDRPFVANIRPPMSHPPCAANRWYNHKKVGPSAIAALYQCEFCSISVLIPSDAGAISRLSLTNYLHAFVCFATNQVAFYQTVFRFMVLSEPQVLSRHLHWKG